MWSASARWSWCASTWYQDWHGTGLVGALMRACLAATQQAGCDALWLSVWQRNPRGVAFYTKQGFAQAGTLTFIVGDDPQSDWLMVRPES